MSFTWFTHPLTVGAFKDPSRSADVNVRRELEDDNCPGVGSNRIMTPPLPWKAERANLASRPRNALLGGCNPRRKRSAFRLGW